MSRKKGNRDAGLAMLADLGLVGDDSDEDNGPAMKAKGGKAKQKAAKKSGAVAAPVPAVALDSDEDDGPKLKGKAAKAAKFMAAKTAPSRGPATAEESDSEEDTRQKGKKGKKGKSAPIPVPADSAVAGDSDSDDNRHKGKKGKKGKVLTLKEPAPAATEDSDGSDNPRRKGNKGKRNNKKGVSQSASVSEVIEDSDEETDRTVQHGKMTKKGKVASKSNKKAAERSDSEEEEDIQSSLNEGGAQQVVAKVTQSLAALAVSDSDSEGEEGDDTTPPPAPLKTAPKVETVAPPVPPASETEGSSGGGSKTKGKMSKAERKKQKSAHKSTAGPTAAPAPVDEPSTAAVVGTLESAASASMGDSDDWVRVESAAPTTVGEEECVDAKGTAAADEVDTGGKKGKKEKKEKPAKKSKLELKLEAAKKAKEEADAAREKAAEEEAETKRRELEELEARQGTADAIRGEGDDGEPVTKKKAKKKKAAVEDEQVDEEALRQATMFGDEVFSEYGHSSSAAAEASSVPDDKKLSNKEKKKLAKEAEARERQSAYDVALMKASAEGAQFAVSQSAVDENDPLWQNALDIIIPSLSISAHNKELFLNAELNISHGRRYGLVGPNGAGKSTLLKMISSGELKLPPRIDFLYVEQEVIADDTSAVDSVLKADKERWNLMSEEAAVLRQIDEADGKNTDALDTRLGEIHQQLAVIGASAAEAKARRILFGLGFTAEMQIRPTKYFSGGWRMRISLARALFIEPTLLMLDEPTNHLDLNAVIWLDDYLQKWKKTLLVVSHDQDFLNSVCQEIIHLEDMKLVVYKGNYDTFKEMEATKRKQLQKAWEKQEKRLRELKSKGQTKQNAEKAVLKSKSREPGARAKKQAAAAQASGVESADSKVELIKRPREYMVRFEFPEVSMVTPPILEVRDVNFRYGPHMPLLFKNVNFGLDMSSRVCIVGPNGSGKSTIIKLITQEVKPTEGEVLVNPRLRVGVYNQHFVDRLPMDEDPVTYIRRMFSNETYQTARNILGRYGLEGHAHTIPIRDLSGGQKARVVFVELSLMAPHLLFLDEPTNNLDIESIDALCDALRAYNGGVVLVSHDARLIETTGCQLWVVDDHDVEPWESGFQGYREHLLRKLEEQMTSIVAGSGERPT